MTGRKMIRAGVTEEAFNALSEEAARQGLTLGAYASAVLTSAVLNPVKVIVPAKRPAKKAKGKPLPAPTDKQWRAINAWLHETGKSYPSDAPKTRNHVLDWARDNGFEG